MGIKYIFSLHIFTKVRRNVVQVCCADWGLDILIFYFDIPGCTWVSWCGCAMTIINLGCRVNGQGEVRRRYSSPGVWRHQVRQLGPDIISTVISVIILIMKTFHISIASLYLRQCRGCDDVNHRSGIRTDTTCHNRYTPPRARHTTHHCSALWWYQILFHIACCKHELCWYLLIKNQEA